MVGAVGVANRIGTVETARHNEMTVGEAETLDLSDATPFNLVWDPVPTAAEGLAGTLERAPPIEADWGERVDPRPTWPRQNYGGRARTDGRQ